MIKKYLFLIALLAFSSIQVHAVATLTVKQTPIKISSPLKVREINREDFFIFLGGLVRDDVRPSYKSIKLKFRDIKADTPLYQGLQKLVYLDLIKNSTSSLSPKKSINALSFYKLAGKIIDLEIASTIPNLEKRNATIGDLQLIKDKIEEKKIENEKGDITLSDDISQKREMLIDIYNTLITSHYNKENFNSDTLLYTAMEGLAQGTGDKYTTFFPPIKNKDFQDALNGNYEGIGAYVDMATPGVVNVISPIAGGPAEKVGIKGKDIILKVGDNVVTEKNSINEVVSWIKGPAGTSILLEIQRGTETLKIEVKRERIIIKEVESKIIDQTTLYVQIRSFGDNTFGDFEKIIDTLKINSQIKKVIFDLRNNPGGYLDVVNDMLSYFVPKEENVSVIKYHNYTLQNKSRGYTDIDFNKYKIILLQNSGTASASEIMIGTIRDYFPLATVIGEKSFGKGSVQTIKPYDDGSSLKYTIAKWFSGKSETGIDGIGIEPNILIENTLESLKEGNDLQLQKALAQ